MFFLVTKHCCICVLSKTQTQLLRQTLYNSFCNLNKINIISLKLKAYSSFYNVNDSIFLFIIEQVFTLSLHFFSSLYIIINFLNISFNYPVKVLYLDLYNCTCHSKYNCASIESKFSFLHP
jgi:hypothetical protein